MYKNICFKFNNTAKKNADWMHFPRNNFDIEIRRIPNKKPLYWKCIWSTITRPILPKSRIWRIVTGDRHFDDHLLLFLKPLVLRYVQNLKPKRKCIYSDHAGKPRPQNQYSPVNRHFYYILSLALFHATVPNVYDWWVLIDKLQLQTGTLIHKANIFQQILSNYHFLLHEHHLVLETELHYLITCYSDRNLLK